MGAAWQQSHRAHSSLAKGAVGHGFEEGSTQCSSYHASRQQPNSLVGRKFGETCCRRPQLRTFQPSRYPSTRIRSWHTKSSLWPGCPRFSRKPSDRISSSTQLSVSSLPKANAAEYCRCWMSTKSTFCMYWSTLRIGLNISFDTARKTIPSDVEIPLERKSVSTAHLVHFRALVRHGFTTCYVGDDPLLLLRSKRPLYAAFGIGVLGKSQLRILFLEERGRRPALAMRS